MALDGSPAREAVGDIGDAATGSAGAPTGEKAEQPRFDLGDGKERTAAEVRKEFDADDAAIEAISGCE